VLKKADRRAAANPLRRLSGDEWAAMEPTWRDAKVGIIDAALARATARPSGNWYVVGASRDIRTGTPFGTTVAGVELVVWRSPEGTLHAGPGACPHLGADMSTAVQSGCELICRWHGLALGPSGRAGWRTLPAHDDGALAWARLDAVGGEEPTAAPILPERPDVDASVVAVASMVGTCEPADVIANRLDPWHGAWFHPHSFADLRVERAPGREASEEDDHFDLKVAFRVSKNWGIPVRARFTCPEPRTIVMHITEGEGAGSVVETHATPLAPHPDGRPRTAVVEATIAHSTRPGFAHARRAQALVRPVMEWTARRLWNDDIEYAERTYAVRAARRRG
jgi:phenylpropionate dioxygenase-like ring-hydroxylating dioxygenase large terminal subunit